MAGTNSERVLLTGGPAIVLVEPQLGENIGMVARAMANFGLAELRLVNPRDGWPSDKARAAASRADHVIDAVAVFDDLPSAARNDPPLTTVRQPIARLGATAVEMLIDLIQEPDPRPRRVVLPTELVIRSSCRPSF